MIRLKKAKNTIRLQQRHEKFLDKDKKYKQDLLKMSQKPRFGLFSFPCGIDTDLDLRKYEKDNPKVVKAQSHNFRAKNFLVVKMKKGNIDNVFFSTPKYNAVGDPYSDRKRPRLRSEDKQRRRELHSVEFKPASGGCCKSKYNSEFLNTPNEPQTPLAIDRTHGPRGFYTSPLKHGYGPGTLLQKKNYEYMPDEFDRRRDMFRKERRINREKYIGRPLI